MGRIISYILLLSAMLVPGLPAQAKLFNGEEFYLGNGMQVIVVPNHRVPIIKHMVWYKSGSADEPAGKGGVAHLLEHLMFRGTHKVPGNRFNEIMDKNGAESNAFTSLDMTAYHQTLDISRLELAMFLEADRMHNLNFSDNDFETERKIVFQERKQRVDNNPAAYFGEALRRNLWQEHPYSRPVTGTDEEILSLTKQDVIDFYKKHYVPNNAVLILSGDIDVYTAKKLAEKYYGNLPRGAEPARKPMPQIEPSIRQKLEMSRPQINGVTVVKSYAAPSFNVKPEYRYALNVLASYMGDGDTSKLYKKLVLRDKKALGVSVSYDGAADSYGMFSISAIPQNGVSSDELIAAIGEAWAEALRELTEEEASRVKQKQLAGLVYLRDNPNDAAYITGSMAVVGIPLAEIEKQADNINAVSAADMRKAAAELENNSSQIIGVLKPEEGK